MSGDGPMSDRSYLSIGEVLSLLTVEFPDVTISKIRFLESQGLIDPERTPSGYRKFYETDVERLRWILRQQRENFLPLKVIRGRLGDDDPEPDAFADAEALVGAPVVASPAEPEPQRIVPREAAAPASGAPRRSPVSASPAAPTPVRERPRRRNEESAPDESRPEVDEQRGDAAYTLEELVTATGLPEARITELLKYGLIAARSIGGTEYFDADAAAITHAAAGFLRFGIEARHLRAFKSAAEREAGLFEQIVVPMLRQRNPVARRQAADTLRDLESLGGELRSALVRQAVREITG